MRLIVTADLHYNHPISRPLADGLIDQINAAGGDVLLLVGDTGVGDGDVLERCLSRFEFAGPKLFVAGNHELWTNRGDSYALFTEELPRRVRAMGWQWLETDPFVAGDVAIVGSVGWYDYSFAQASLGIPDRFYAAKMSPGAATYLGGYEALFERQDDINALARDTIARWNDGKFIKLGRDDHAFLDECLARLSAACEANANARQIIAAVHHLPFRELLPPPKSAQWDFAKAYLGSERIGQALLRYPNVSKIFCGHSHMPGEVTVGHITAVNIGSGYRYKTFKQLDL
jgi:predicted phosphohydrolase